MNKTMIAAALAAGVIFGYSGRVWTQTDQKLPMAGFAPAKDIPGARELPNPEVDYKVVFSVAAVAKPEEIHPTLKTIALYLNTLAHNGVPAGHRHIAAVFHQGGGDAVLANDVYKARHNGTTNPNIALLHELKQAGVELRVCGQGLLGKKARTERRAARRPGGPLGDDDDGQPAAAGLRPHRRLAQRAANVGASAQSTCTVLTPSVRRQRTCRASASAHAFASASA